jgi:hypothetical protein
MKRVLVGVIAAMAISSVALPAQGVEVSRSRFDGYVAWATWNAGESQTGDTFANVAVMQSTSGEGVLVVTVFDGWPCDGEPEPTCTRSAGETTEFTFTVDDDLGTATLIASDVPVETCGPSIGCFDTTIDVNVTWTAMGDATRGPFTNHSADGGFIDVSHSMAVTRFAVASGTVGSTTWTEEESDPSGTFLSRVRRGSVSICVPC